MPDVAVPAMVAAGLLVLAGAQKLVDPTMTIGALRALGWPASSWLVRAGSTAELAIGAGALAIGGPLWWLVVASYLAFGGFVVVVLRRGTMIGSCGCFGREETPPHPLHAVLDVLLASAAAVAAASTSEPIATSIADEPRDAIAPIVLALVGLYLAYAAFVELPRTLVEVRRTRSVSR